MSTSNVFHNNSNVTDYKLERGLFTWATTVNCQTVHTSLSLMQFERV